MELDEELLAPTALQVLEAHIAPVRFVVPLSDNCFATAGDDGILSLWSTTGELLSSVHAHSAPISAVISLEVANPTDTTPIVATAAEDGLICLISANCTILFQLRHADGAKV